MRAVPLFLILAATPICASEIFESAQVRICSVELLQKAAWGLSGSFERAAFVVQGTDGALECDPWPPRHFYLSEAFRGPMPFNTVAIVHTHPAEYPRPSGHDIDEAARIGKPIYVLSILGVYKVDPRSRGVSRIFAGRSWMDQIPNAAMVTPRVAMRAPAATSP